MGVPWDVKVSYFIREGSWYLPPPRSSRMEEVCSRISQVRIHGGEDRPVRPDGTGATLWMKEVWSWVRQPGRKVPWAGMVWHKFVVPKHTLTAWRALKGRLLTKRRMIKRGVNLDPTCVLCEDQEEDMEHLFWNCQYTKEVWRCLLNLMQLHQTAARNLESEVLRLSHASGSRLDKVVRKWVVSATWHERNRRIFEGERQQPQATIAVVKDIIRSMSYQASKLAKDEGEARHFQDTWN